MRSAAAVATVLAFAGRTIAQTAGFGVMSVPGQAEEVPSGETFTIEWDASTYTGAISLSLIGGATQNTQVPISTIATGIDITTESFAWSVDCELGTDAVYGLKLSLDSDPDTFQWSFPFAIKGPSCGSSSSSSSATVDYPTSSSAAPPSSTPVSSYPVSISTSTTSTVVKPSYSASVTSTSSGFPTLTPTGNGTTTATPTTLVTTTPSGTGSSSPLPTAGAGKAAAGSLALIGGLAAALLAF
ncbi:Ser-Thr-rich glycosyl-phosphatidyl-inositol-anchored membrane family-domain-containing protein [Xylariomycetidae sp. FL2044]|nr:Ser-Thr-rich glycosyl-phosphatidyl-inositol-anchored membrane family-domain-containing protein [Xylariomycetidae sp. FL2044]